MTTPVYTSPFKNMVKDMDLWAGSIKVTQFPPDSLRISSLAFGAVAKGRSPTILRQLGDRGLLDQCYMQTSTVPAEGPAI